MNGVLYGKPNMALAIKHLQDNAEPKSTNKCAKYVRIALNQGGFYLKKPEYSYSAKDYGFELKKIGFHNIQNYDGKNPSNLSQDGCLPGYSTKSGDVIIIQPYEGGNESGHMAMYDGQQWISDFKQRSIYPGKGYRAAKPPYAVYRYL